jgi:hypothetical protein
MIMDIRPELLLKALSPILVTLSGITVSAQPIIKVLLAVSMMALQSSLLSYTSLALSTVMLPKTLPNAPPSIWVILAGIKSENDLQNASAPMPVTLSGILVASHPITIVSVAVSMTALQSFLLSYFSLSLSTAMLVNSEHSWNGLPSMLVTLPGITIEVKLLQNQNAFLPMLVKLSGKVIDDKLVH